MACNVPPRTVIVDDFSLLGIPEAVIDSKVVLNVSTGTVTEVDYSLIVLKSRSLRCGQLPGLGEIGGVLVNRLLRPSLPSYT